MPRPNVYSLPTDSAATPRLLVPGSELAPADAVAFTALVSSRDPSHFCEADRPLLNAAARAIRMEQDVAAALVGQPLVVQARNGPQPNPLVAMQREQQRLIAALLRGLRMTPQSRMSRDKAANTTTPSTPNLTDALALARSHRNGH
jgi:hypothetical protein